MISCVSINFSVLFSERDTVPLFEKLPRCLEDVTKTSTSNNISD